MLEIANAQQSPFKRLGLDSFSSISKYFLRESPPQKTAAIVRRGEIPLADGASHEVFYKQYEFASPQWKFLCRPSKALCEWRNYAVFARLGIPCPEPIACGEERDPLGRLRRAFIITRAIPESETLIQFWQKPSPQAARKKLLLQLAGLARRIHEAGFFHHDLVWRNILVSAQNAADPQLWWIDCPRGSFDSWSPLRRRKQLKDLASLDKSAVKFCTRRERLAFLEAYLGGKRLDAEVKSLARAVVDYRRTRWPEDWEGK